MNLFGAALALLGTAATDVPDRPTPPCRIWESPPGTRLMVAGHYEAKTHSTAWLGDPEEPTGVVDVRLDPGDPVHLVLTTFRPVVYRFSGAVERVRHLSLMSQDGAGAVGIPRGRISFLPRCLSAGEGVKHAARFAGEAAKLLGRPPGSVATTGAVWRLRIGRAIMQLDRRGWTSAADVETERLLANSPGGVALIDPAAVVTNAAVGDYEVLPQEAGLRRLLTSGALVRAADADAEAWEAAARARGAPIAHRPDIEYKRAYRAVRPIRIPAGLCGAHAVAFYARSPRYLHGNRCHSVLFFDDGTDSGAYRP